VGTGFGKINIHKLRTTFKKLRALLRLQKEDKILASYKKTYHVCGELRNIQIMLSPKQEELKTIPGFIKWLNLFMEVQKEDWNKIHSVRIMGLLSEKIKKTKVKKIDERKFFKKKIAKTKAILKLSFIPDDKIHEIRKKLKDVQYVLSLTKKKGKQNDSLLNETRLKSINEKIGNYMDEKIALLLLKKYFTQETKITALRKAAKLQKEWEERKSNNKIRLIKLLKQTIG